jgi:predicted phage terminase large subunit-like protein
MERRLDKLLPLPSASYQAADESSPREGILDFQVRVSPKWKRANHFRIYAEKLENAVGGDQRVVFSAPPQHGKTEVTLHGLAWLILQHPGKRHAYITYSTERTRSVARKFRRLLEAAGIPYTGSLNQIVLDGGGQCLFTSIDAGITGEPVDGIAIIDDPIKNRQQADSAARREVIDSAYREAIETRVHPGASIFVLATRWHPQDLSGTLIEEGWDYINLPAIAEENDPNGRAVGEPLFPECRPLDFLLKKKEALLDFGFSALYQGRPRPKGGKVFHEPTFYSKLPTEYRGAYGIDLAYTSKSSSDWSVNLELWRAESRVEGNEPVFYVVHVDRAKVEPPVFAVTLKERHGRRPWPMLWRASGTEKGSASFFVADDIPVEVRQPPGDKLVCATDVAAAWNAGRVLVPDTDAFPEAEVWLPAFLDIVANFTGSGKEHDDDVDALGNAFEALKSDEGGVFRVKSNRGR